MLSKCEFPSSSLPTSPVIREVFHFLWYSGLSDSDFSTTHNHLKKKNLKRLAYLTAGAVCLEVTGANEKWDSRLSS